MFNAVSVNQAVVDAMNTVNTQEAVVYSKTFYNLTMYVSDEEATNCIIYLTPSPVL